ncbi:autotransporter outer membrane beta-barrel domain-containing protein [Helicobacter sp. 12S02634-8]|uniref:autotransporter outer membrane beta-barrel domain-containing protein n=1 Tax=Helicobacter sp. 12S02634-8 TaxID=1476199 RepID=UPI00155423E7|nr:autotransporter outer membrane beta-barrel domain-containing protein [Helicobacter sp. 12S02634-8]
MKRFFVFFYFILPLLAQGAPDKWEELPATYELNSGETKQIDVMVDKNKNFYNKSGFTYSTNGSSPSTLILQPDTTTSISSFYNESTIKINPNSQLQIHFTNTNFISNANSSYAVSKGASLQVLGKEFTSYGGGIYNQGTMELNLSSSFNNVINKNGTQIQVSQLTNNGGTLTINTPKFNNGDTANGIGSQGVFETTNGATSTIIVTKEFNNFGYIYKILNGQISGDKNLDAISTINISNQSTLTIQSGNVYNGGTIKNSIYDDSGAGAINIDDSKLIIQQALFSEGAGKTLNAASASNAVRSQIHLKNHSTLQVGTDFTNGKYSDILLYDGSQIEVGNTFESTSGSRIFFSGDSVQYGKIQAKDIKVKDATLKFFKGSARPNKPYTFLQASNSLEFDNTLLSLHEVTAEDGSTNQFYQVSIAQKDNALTITFIDTTAGKKLSEIIAEQTPLTSNEATIIDAIDTISTQGHLNGLDIRNLGNAQIKDMSVNIQEGIATFAHSKDVLTQSRFDTIRASVFDRMIASQSQPIVLSALPRYASNTIALPNSTPQSDYISQAYPRPIPAAKNNSVYASLLGAYQTNTTTKGYSYGINAGIDKKFTPYLFLGLYTGYIASNAQFTTLSTRTHSFQLGAYMRAYQPIGHIGLETDTILGYDYGASQANKTITIATNSYAQHTPYATHAFNLLVQSGPKFDIFHTHTIKPYLGVNLYYEINHKAQERGVFESEYLFKNHFYTRLIAGIEYRKYMERGYFFIRPAFAYTVYSNLKNIEVLFLNNTLTIPTPPKEHFASVTMGGEIPFSKQFLIHLNASMQASTQKSFVIGGSAALKYVF